MQIINSVSFLELFSLLNTSFFDRVIFKEKKYFNSQNQVKKWTSDKDGQISVNSIRFAPLFAKNEKT